MTCFSFLRFENTAKNTGACGAQRRTPPPPPDGEDYSTSITVADGSYDRGTSALFVHFFFLNDGGFLTPSQLKTLFLQNHLDLI